MSCLVHQFTPWKLQDNSFHEREELRECVCCTAYEWRYISNRTNKVVRINKDKKD